MTHSIITRADLAVHLHKRTYICMTVHRATEKISWQKYVSCGMQASAAKRGDKLLSVNMSKTQAVIFNDFRHSHTDSFVYGGQALRIVDHYTY